MRRLLVLLSVLLLVTAACGDDDAAEGPTTTPADTATSTTTTEPDTTTTTRDADDVAGTPDELVAVRADGTVVVADAEDGTVVRTLLEDVEVAPAKNDVAVSPDGRTAYVVRPSAEAEPVREAEVVAVPVAGGEPQTVVAAGLSPSVSPDGTRLAYIALETSEGAPSPVPVLVIRDLTTGDERVLRRQEEREFTFVADTAWADESTVLFLAGEIRTGLYAVDAGAAGLDASERIGPTDRGDGASWLSVTPLGDERVAVAETCCDVGEKERWLVLSVHLPTASVEGGLLPGERVEATRLDADAGSDGLLIVLRGGPEGGTLQRWEDGSEPTTLLDGVITAAW